MKKIGEGYFYNVYEVDAKILKKQKSKVFIFLHILFRSLLKNTVRKFLLPQNNNFYATLVVI
jgi:hypothetical protein